VSHAAQVQAVLAQAVHQGVQAAQAALQEARSGWTLGEMTDGTVKAYRIPTVKPLTPR